MVTPKRQPCLRREQIGNARNYEPAVKHNPTNSSLSIIQWSASVATSLQSPRCFLLKNYLRENGTQQKKIFKTTIKLLQFACLIQKVLFQKVANTAFDVPNVPEGDSWCSKQIPIVEQRKFQPMFSCDMPEPLRLIKIESIAYELIPRVRTQLTTELPNLLDQMLLTRLNSISTPECLLPGFYRGRNLR